MAQTKITKPQAGVPASGTTGQALVKNSNTNYDYDWATVSAGATAISFVAAEAIDGSIDPKAVFVGTFPNPQSSQDGRYASGNPVSPSVFDYYNPGSNAVHSISWQNLKFGYLIPAGRNYNALVFQIWRNNWSVPVTIEFFNTGVATPTGVAFKTFSKTITTVGAGGLDDYAYFFDDNVDCTATLGGGNNYWMVLTFGAEVGNPVDMAPHIAGTAPNFLEWNGVAWVAPFTSPGRSPGISLALIPTGSLIYASKGDDIYDAPNASGMDNVAAGRARFLGFITSNVAQGGTASVVINGAVTFTTPLRSNSGPAALELGTSLGEIVPYNVFSTPPTRLPVGTSYDTQSLIINKGNGNAPFTFDNGQYQ